MKHTQTQNCHTYVWYEKKRRERDKKATHRTLRRMIFFSAHFYCIAAAFFSLLASNWPQKNSIRSVYLHIWNTLRYKCVFCFCFCSFQYRYEEYLRYVSFLRSPRTHKHTHPSSLTYIDISRRVWSTPYTKPSTLRRRSSTISRATLVACFTFAVIVVGSCLLLQMFVAVFIFAYFVVYFLFLLLLLLMQFCNCCCYLVLCFVLFDAEKYLMEHCCCSKKSICAIITG